MPTQTIDFNDVEQVSFNNQPVKRMFFNGNRIWDLNRPYVTFVSTVNFTLSTRGNVKYWDGIIEYSTDYGSTWTEWDGTTPINSGLIGIVNTIYVRGTGNTVITGPNGNSAGGWVLTPNPFNNTVFIGGNIESLLDYYTVSQNLHPIMDNYCFYCLFKNNTKLSLVNGSIFENTYDTFLLPSETLTAHCYNSMFNGCKALTTAPILPATTLAERCYSSMFYGCTSLTTAPALPATTLESNCYNSMFYDCTSLTTAPVLPATTLAERCYSAMFYGCKALTTAPALPATTLASYCYSSMFNGCTSLTTAPALPATTLESNCYNAMFRNCTNIKMSTTQTSTYINEYRIPTSGTGTTASNALSNMFTNTGGDFVGTPTINTKYYTSNTIIS